MRWLLTLGAITVAGLGLFWLLDGGGGPDRRHDDRPEAGVRPDKGGIALPETTGLQVSGGVALAPDFDAPAENGAEPEAEETPEHFYIARAIFHGTNEPVVHAEVLLEQVGGEQAWAQPKTDRRGVLRVHQPAGAKGPLRIVVRGPRGAVGIAPARPKLKPDAGKGVKQVTDLGVIRVGGDEVLTGFVYGAAGALLAGQEVRAYRFVLKKLPDGVVARAVSDERGWFEMKGLPAGLYLLRSEDADGRRYLRYPVVVPRTDPLALRPLPHAKLAVTVRDTAGRPSSAAHVEAWPLVAKSTGPLAIAHYLEPWYAETDAKGGAVFETLPFTDYTLHVTLADKAPFEFAHAHRSRTDRTLRVATRTRIAYAFYKGLPPKNPVPIPNTKLRLTVEGRGTVAKYDQFRTLTVTTDEAAVVTLPRLGARTQILKAVWIEDDRAGTSPIEFARTLEIATPWPVVLRPRPPPETAPAPAGRAKGAVPPARVRRTVRVVTPEGLPVKGAVVYAEDGDARATTSAEGIAVLRLPSGAPAFLRRPDLASGDPRTNGDRITWHPGRRVVLEVVDDQDGFAIAGARVGPRRTAWRRVGPGVFATLWGESDEPVTATARGYELWKQEVPPDGGRILAKLRPPPEPPTAALLAEVTRSNRPAQAVFVSGTWHRGNDEGRASFLALTGPDGRAFVPDLREGEWTLHGAAVDGATGKVAMRLARGLNPIALPMNENLPLSGVVRDGRRQPIAGAEVRLMEISGHRLRPGRERETSTHVLTGSDGSFTLRVSPNAPVLLLRVKAPGHAPVQQFVRRPDFEKKLVIRLPAVASLDLPVRWADGGSDPIPEDVSVRLNLRSFASRERRRRWVPLGRFPVRDGRLVVAGVAPGRVAWGDSVAVHGAAWVRSGRTTRDPAVLLRRGGTVEGVVLRDKRGVPFETIHLIGRTRLAVVTDEEGAFVRENVPPGNYSVAHPYQREGSARANKQVVVTAGNSSKVRVEIRK